MLHYVISPHDCVYTLEGVDSEAFLKKTPSLLKDCVIDNNEDTSCSKDTGERTKLQTWSRGHLFIVRPCGHIDTWQPLYK